ncbi:MAG: TIGR04084 family radical SAM/SPASM domain-containing protein [Candidatus Thorarchaeota archaeon]
MTKRCNLNCQYCHGGEDIGSDTEIQYNLEDLATFLDKDDEIQLMLYGGEPTLRIPLIVELMNRFPQARFMLQTNALLLNKIPEEYAKRFHSILISIDGPEMVTDGYRTKGVYQKVLANTHWLEKIGYEGDIVTRMAISQESDIYRDVTHLLDLQEPSFKHVHWQLNVIWDADGNWQDFDKWVEESYNPGISRLVDEWVDNMEQGIVGGIVPFIPLVYTLLTGETSNMRCGSGIDTFAIHVNGSVGVCPISPDWEFSIVGDISTSDPKQLRNIMSADEPCPSCKEYGVCGGRCLFTNKQRLWGEAGYEKVCNTVKHLTSELRKQIPRIERFIAEELISIDDFKYPEYNNGCEIIP